MVLSMSSPPTVSPSDPPNPRKRGRTACTRCKSRKQKCDDRLPICSNCARSGAACDKANVTVEAIPASYTRALEDRVAFLETTLQGLQQRQDAAPVDIERDSHTARKHDHNDLRDIVGLITTGNPEEPAYVGPSSGTSLATILNEMVQATVWNKSLPEATSPTSATDGPGRSNSRRMEIEELISQSVKEPPSDQLGSRMIRAYLGQLHPRYPFLEAEEIWKLHGERCELHAIPQRELSRQKRFGIFKLDLIYAIGGTLLQLTDKKTNIYPEGFYFAALRHISAARESRTIQNIEAMILLVIFHLRSASSHGMWYMIGLAMRSCIDLGMHRRENERRVSSDVVDQRRRLFWTVYSLERTIAISLGRPTSISDRQIDLPFPATREETQDLVRQFANRPRVQGGMSLIALHLFRLRRIESRIQDSIYRVDRSLSALRPKVEPLFNLLAAWKTSMTSSFPSSSPELNYPLLHYHRAVRLLIQPFLPLMTPEDPYHAICLRAAGDICQAHKRLHQSLDYGHSFIAVQTVFVAGMTLVYGLWKWLQDVWTSKLADDIRACSLILFVMSERAEWVRRYRDAFEVLVNAAMDKLNGGDPQLLSRERSQNYTNARESNNDQPEGELTRSPSAYGAPEDGTQQEKEAPDHSFDPWEAVGGIATGQDSEAWPIVMELASWMDQEGHSPTWMPNFEALDNLAGQ